MEDRLRQRGMQIADGCLMCSEENETINHILLQCPLARQVWALSLAQTPALGFGTSIFTNIAQVIHNSQNLGLSLILRSVSPWIIWVLWKNRNYILFEGLGSLLHQLVDKAYEDCHLWIMAQEFGLQVVHKVL